MPSTARFSPRRALARAWSLLDAGRRALLNLLLLAVLAAAVALAWRGGAPPALQPKTTLVLDLSGRIVDQRSGGARDGLLRRARGQAEGELLLRDVLAALDVAARDPNIGQALLLLDGLQGSGLPTLRDVAAAIGRFKAAGKPVVAWGAGYDQRQFFLAAHAGEVWLDPMGGVLVQGYGSPRSYYRDAFDRLGVAVHVVRAGRYKNAAETFTARGPTPETVEADAALHGALWSSWTATVERERRLPPGSIAEALESLPASLVAAGGDGARWALQRRWVDALKTRAELRAELVARGAPDTAGGDDGKGNGAREPTFRQVSLGAYLARIDRSGGGEGDAVGVVVAQGPISSGTAPPGRVGGLSTAELVRRARTDDRIKAVVLRVDSPGGSAYGSELVRRELEATRRAGKPVVVSMGDVAASGGYWVSLAADEVVADEATITGSIGVISMLPTVRGALDKLGIHSAGVGTTWLAGAYDLRHGLDPRFEQLVQAGVDGVYRDFTARAAAARRTTPERIDAVAQGRVWAGKDALALGLVDRLGGYGDALHAAARRAGLAPGWRVRYVEGQPGLLARVLQRLPADVAAPVDALAGVVADAVASALSAALGDAGALPAWAAVLAGDGGGDAGALDELRQWLAAAARGERPAALAHCLCAAP